MKGIKTKIIISVLALSLAVFTAVTSFAYFSSYQNYDTLQNINTGRFEFDVLPENFINSEDFSYGETVFTALDFKASTIINFPKISDSEDETEHIIYLRRGDDENFDSVTNTIEMQIDNLCYTDIIFNVYCDFYLGNIQTDGTQIISDENKIDFIEYFFISQSEKENIDNNGMIDGALASQENYLRHYTDLIANPGSVLTSPATPNYVYLRQRFDEIRQFNKFELENARKLSAINNTIPKGQDSENTFISFSSISYLFFWADYAGIEEYYKQGYSDYNYINSNKLNVFSEWQGIDITARITFEFTQSINQNFI